MQTDGAENMIKKSIALATALTFAAAFPMVAAEATVKTNPAPFKNGTITSWDATAKHGALKDGKGVETTFVWNEKTTFTGTAKVGEHAYLWSKKDQDGKETATHVTFGTRLVMQKAAPKNPPPPPPEPAPAK
jgi:hypothetical protein